MKRLRVRRQATRAGCLIWFLSSVLLLTGGAARAASADNTVELEGLFHDQGPLFDSALEPSSRIPVTVRFRSFRDDLTAAAVKSFNETTGDFSVIPMDREAGAPDRTYDYWKATIPASASPKRYRFELCDGEQTVWFNASGTTSSEPGSGDFYIVPGFKTPQWLKNGIIYQIFVDRFCNGDQSNDVKDGQYEYAGKRTMARKWGVSPQHPDPAQRQLIFYGGDLKGVVSKISYIRDEVGANIVYLSPIFKSPTNHKYDTADYDQVDPAFGTAETLAQLSRALHEPETARRGYLILDGVFNHTGDSHKWFGKYLAEPGTPGAFQSQTSPFVSFYTFYHWHNDYAHFLSFDSLPKLNFGFQGVKKAIYASPESITARYQNPPFRIDGWRLDAAQYADLDGREGSDEFNHGIWREFRSAVKSRNPEAAIIGEFWGNASAWTATGDQWDSATNFDGFTDPVSRWITGRTYTNELGSLSVTEFDRWLRRTRSNYPTNVLQSMSNHLSNHDTSRFGEQASGDISKTCLALFFQMTYVGVPTIYYGDEYGMQGCIDAENRRSFDWSAAGNSAVTLTHRLTGLRNKYAALRTGSFMTMNVDDNRRIYIYGRLDSKNRIAVVLNNDSTSHQVEVPVYKLEIPDGASLRDEITDQTLRVRDGKVTISVPGHYGSILVN